MLTIQRVKHGFTLIEIMIALLLGSLLLIMVIGLYVTNVSAGHKTLSFSQLRANLQGIVGLMESDIRRAGYGGADFMVGVNSNKVIDTINTETQKCLVYAYNDDNSSSVTSSHYMGFRYSLKNESLQFGRGVDKQASLCFSSGYWVNLSDPNFLKIKNLSFSESLALDSLANFRSVDISITGELLDNPAYRYQITTHIKVRNPEYE